MRTSFVASSMSEIKAGIPCWERKSTLSRNFCLSSPSTTSPLSCRYHNIEEKKNFRFSNVGCHMWIWWKVFTLKLNKHGQSQTLRVDHWKTVNGFPTVWLESFQISIYLDIWPMRCIKQLSSKNINLNYRT